MVFLDVFFPHYFCLYIIIFILICIYLSIGIFRCELFSLFCYISAWEIFWLFCRWGLGMHHSPFTHTHIAHYMSGALYPGLSNLELEGIV